MTAAFKEFQIDFVTTNSCTISCSKKVNGTARVLGKSNTEICDWVGDAVGNAWGASWHILVIHSVTTVLVLVGSLAVLVNGGVIRSTWGVILASIDVLRSESGNVGFFGRLLHTVLVWCKVSIDLLM